MKRKPLDLTIRELGKQKDLLEEYAVIQYLILSFIITELQGGTGRWYRLREDSLQVPSYGLPRYLERVRRGSKLEIKTSDVKYRKIVL